MSHATGSTSALAAPLSIPEQLGSRMKVFLPKHNEQELRSYHYFLEVAAPALSGVFEGDFWVKEIPQTCYLDPAMWHAVVSLGAVYEHSFSLEQGASSKSSYALDFAVSQFNAAVKHLLHSDHQRSILEEKWRALVASLLFTYLCSIQGLHSQSTIHLSAAKNILTEILNETPPSSPNSDTAVKPPSPRTLLKPNPISYQHVLSLIANLEMDSQMIHNPGVNSPPPLLSQVEPFCAYQTYTARSARNPPLGAKTCEHGRCFPSRATPGNLSAASKASYSLLQSLIQLSQTKAEEKEQAIVEGDATALEKMIQFQQPHARVFVELDVALNVFIRDTSQVCRCGANVSSATKSRQHERVMLVIKSLRLFRAICYPLLYDKPVGVSQLDGTTVSIGQFEIPSPYIDHLLDLAESVIVSQKENEKQRSSNNKNTDTDELILVLSPMQPLLVIASHAGAKISQRRRAIALFRMHPWRDGLLDSRFMAALGEGMLEYEISSEMDKKKSKEREFFESDLVIPEERHISWASVAFTGSHSATLSLQTMGEWVGGKPGRDIICSW